MLGGLSQQLCRQTTIPVVASSSARSVLGGPSPATSESALHGLQQRGQDLIEVGGWWSVAGSFSGLRIGAPST